MRSINTMARGSVWVAAGALLLLTAACSEPPLDDATVQATDQVSVRDSNFSARSIEVPAGSTVTWTWEGDAQHNVAGDGWQSPTQKDGSFQREFEEPGVYDYKCQLHGNMTGRVTVIE